MDIIIYLKKSPDNYVKIVTETPFYKDEITNSCKSLLLPYTTSNIIGLHQN